MVSEYCQSITGQLWMSRICSFAVIFEPIWYDVNGTLDLYCDGGVMNQYPIHCFDGEYVMTTATPVLSQSRCYRLWRSVGESRIPRGRVLLAPRRGAQHLAWCHFTGGTQSYTCHPNQIFLWPPCTTRTHIRTWPPDQFWQFVYW